MSRNRVGMGVRQSQDQPPGASPVEVGGPQVSPHRPRAMPTPEDYTHLHRAPQLSAARPHGQRGLSEGDSRGVNLDPRGLNLDSRELLQLDLALSRLQQRLASRANADATARDRPHSHQSPRVRPHQTHSAHSYDGSAMPFIFVRGISCECVRDMSSHVSVICRPVSVSVTCRPVSVSVMCPVSVSVICRPMFLWYVVL